jgi:Rnl2 family RNA ligase
MEFKKYNSLENHYHSKHIAMFLNMYPELKDAKYIITEKIHGSNIQVCINESEYKVGKRSSFILNEKDDKGMKNVCKYIKENYSNAIKEIQEYIKGHEEIEEMIFYGEYFGRDIQKGVDYGNGKQVVFFDLKVNGSLQDWVKFKTYTTNFNLPIVPEIDVVNSLEEALEFDTKFDSKILNKKDNLCEGIVIKPLGYVYRSPQGSVFYIKKKNAKFLEKIKQPKANTPKELTIIGKYQEIFKTYITKNRMDNIMSKYGEIQENKQISDYIRYFLEDAKEDFFKENDISFLEEKEKRAVFNVGSMVFNLIKEYL